MRENITLRTAEGGEKTLSFLATATTSIRYRNLFGTELMEDLISMLSGMDDMTLAKVMKLAQSGEDISLDNADPETLKALLSIAGNGGLASAQKLAYVMNMQAEKSDMNNLTMDSYLEWLEQFDSKAFLENAMDFMGLYIGNKQGTSIPKKNTGQQTGM